MSFQRAGAALLVGLAILAAPAGADEIRLRNGDRITGKVLRKSPTALIVQTRYAGEITIRWDEVIGVATEEPVRLQAQGSDEIVLVRLLPAPAGQTIIEPAINERTSLPLAQIAFINPTPAESDRGTVYDGRINVAADATTGNTDSSRVRGELDFEGAGRTSRFSIALRADREKFRDSESNSRWRANGDYDRFIAANRFVYARTSFERDPFSDIRLRATAGVGHGWQLIQSLDTKLSLRTGLDYVAINHFEAPRERFPALGWGVKYTHRLFGRRVEVFHEHEGYWDLVRTDDVTLISRTGMRLPILPGLHTTTQLNLDWDGDPTGDQERLDAGLSFGVGYEW